MTGVGGPRFRALEWLVRRRDGESLALIAVRDGVSPYTVKRATAPFGPFPRATRYPGKALLPDEVVDARTQRWVQARRNGTSVKEIARRDGVSHQLVSRCTIDSGPYPCENVVQQWVIARRDRQSVAAIAEKYDAPIALVRRHTQPWGPFPHARHRLPAGVVGVNGIARLAGISEPAALRWVRTGRIPDPDFITRTGRLVWLEHTIITWFEDAKLATCPTCGARCISLGQHHAAAHP